MSITTPRIKRLLIIGPYPPPYGGVSTHIKRLIELLSKDLEIKIIDESKQKKVKIFNLRSFKLIPYLALVIKSDIIHIHSGHFVLRLIHFTVSKLFGKKVIITVHSYTEKNKGKLERYTDRLIFKRSNKVVFVNEKIFKKFALPNSYIKEAFLPPFLNSADDLPESISKWLTDKKKNHYFVCCANAWRLDTYNSEDLYGLDLCIEIAKRCKENNIKIAFIFIISDPNGKLKTDTYRRLIASYKIEELFFIYDASISFIKLIIESDLVLRPTNTDGDALTVREGLFFGKPVIASDIVRRPKHTQLFKNRDIDSLQEKVEEVYDGLVKRVEFPKLKDLKQESRVSDEIKFYRDILYS